MENAALLATQVALRHAESGLHSPTVSQSYRTSTDMSRQVVEMIELARRYCGLIDTSGRERSSWLREISELLPRLQAAIASLDGQHADASAYLTPDLDARFELFSHLRELLGERDAYWLEFDQAGDSQSMTGSLADDLTDIYCELKHGLRLIDDDAQQAIKGWIDGYEVHWARHLADAQRHLSYLTSEGRLDG